MINKRPHQKIIIDHVHDLAESWSRSLQSELNALCLNKNSGSSVCGDNSPEVSKIIKNNMEGLLHSVFVMIGNGSEVADEDVYFGIVGSNDQLDGNNFLVNNIHEYLFDGEE